MKIPIEQSKNTSEELAYHPVIHLINFIADANIPDLIKSLEELNSFANTKFSSSYDSANRESLDVLLTIINEVGIKVIDVIEALEAMERTFSSAESNVAKIIYANGK